MFPSYFLDIFVVKEVELGLSFYLCICNELINLTFVKNTGNISLGTCKSCKQTRACALVCLPDLQLPLEKKSCILNQRWINLYFLITESLGRL